MPYIVFGSGPLRKCTRNVDDVKEILYIADPFTGNYFIYRRLGTLWNGHPNYEYDRLEMNDDPPANITIKPNAS